MGSLCFCEKYFTEEWLNTSQYPSSDWTNLNHDNTVIIINSDSKLKEYFVGTGDNYPNINFSKQTLLIASGMTPYGLYRKNIKGLQRILGNRYNLNIELYMGDTANIDNWAVALITKKISDNADIKLNVKIKK